MWEDKGMAGNNSEMARMEHKKDWLDRAVESKPEAKSLKGEKANYNSSYNIPGVHSMAAKKQKNMEGRRCEWGRSYKENQNRCAF